MDSSDQAYLQILNNRVSDISKRISKLHEHQKSIFALHNHIEKTVDGLQIELDRLKNEIKELSESKKTDFEFGKTVSFIDRRYDKKTEKEKKYSSIIDELKKIKSETKTTHGNRTIDSRIERFEKKLKRIKEKKVRINNIQRKIMFPKYRYMFYKQARIDKREGKVVFNQARVDDNELVKNSITGNSIFSSIKRKYYDIKGIYYNKQLNRSKAAFERLKDKNTKKSFEGCRTIPLDKKTKEKCESTDIIPYDPAIKAVPSV